VRDTPELYKLGYDASDAAIPSAILESALTVFLYEAMRDAIKKHQPDVILTTYPLYQSALEAVFVINDTHVPLLTAITDLVTVHKLWFDDRVDLCLVPTESVKKLALENGIPESKISVTGIPIKPDYSKISTGKEALRTKLGWDTKLTTFLLVTSKRFTKTDKHIQVLNHFGAPIQLVIVTGNDEELLEKLQQAEWHIPVKIYPFIDNMPEVMKASDIIITKAGGLIVSESLASGLPMILFDVIPGQETGNADYVIKNDAGTLIETQMQLLETLAHLTSNHGELWKSQADNARRLGIPDSAYKTADLIWQVVSRGHSKADAGKSSGKPRLIDLLSKNKIRWEDNPFKLIAPK
jgi:1,2-diacylglycerol 3-beta-galactosyltransferase